MGYHRVRVNFTEKGIQHVQNVLQKMIDTLPELQKKFLDKSVDYLYDRAVYHIQDSTGNSSYMPTGELLAGMKKDKELHRIFNDCSHAKWVEFGTGIVGAGTHPKPVNGYQYDVNNHGELGWTYKGDDGNYYHTTGMEAHRFMYDAVIDYELKAKSIFSQCFDEWIGGAKKV